MGPVGRIWLEAYAVMMVAAVLSIPARWLPEPWQSVCAMLVLTIMLAGMFSVPWRLARRQRVQQEDRQLQRNCSNCRRAIVLLPPRDAPEFTFGGAMRRQLDAVICMSCGKLECTACKGTPYDGPCRWCGGAVAPAFE